MKRLFSISILCLLLFRATARTDSRCPSQLCGLKSIGVKIVVADYILGRDAARRGAQLRPEIEVLFRKSGLHIDNASDSQFMIDVTGRRMEADACSAQIVLRLRFRLLESVTAKRRPVESFIATTWEDEAIVLSPSDRVGDTIEELIPEKVKAFLVAIELVGGR